MFVMKDILIVREDSNFEPAIYEFINNRYEATESPFDSKEVEYICQNNGIRMIVLFIEDISSPATVELRRILMYIKNIHFCLLGSHHGLSAYSDMLDKDYVHCIEVPVPITKFQEYFEFIVEQYTGLKSFDDARHEHKRHILLVDDDPVCLRNMMNWLKNFYQVSVAKSGAACISFLGKVKPDLILLDYEMPVCNGVQTLEMIRSEKEYDEIPVMFLTGVSDVDKVKEALRLKPQGYILKNTDRVDFLSKINMIFSR